MNLFRRAEKARIKRFVYTSSIAAVVNMEVQPWTNDSACLSLLTGLMLMNSAWNPITKEGIQGYGGSYVYGKTQAEKALWDFAAENKNLDVTTCKSIGVACSLPTFRFWADEDPSLQPRLFVFRGPYPAIFDFDRKFPRHGW